MPVSGLHAGINDKHSEGVGRPPPDLLGPRLPIRLRKLRTQMANNLYRMLLPPTDKTTLAVTQLHRLARACHPGGCVTYGKTLLEVSYRPFMCQIAMVKWYPSDTLW